MVITGLRAAGTPRRDGARAGSATVLTWVLPHLVAHVAARGCDASPIGQIPGLQGKDLNDPDTRVTDGHMAEAISAGALDLLEYAFRASTTLEAGLGQIARYGRVVSDRAAAELTEQGDVVTVLFGAATQRQRIDFALAFLVKLAREATGTPLAVRWVRWRRQYACSRLVKLGSRP